MSARVSPAERAALPVARAALESRASAYGVSDAIVFALGSAGLLQSPETAAELVRLRKRVAELETAARAGAGIFQQIAARAQDGQWPGRPMLIDAATQLDRLARGGEPVER